MIKKLLLTLTILAMVACTETPTGVQDFSMSDPEDKKENGDGNGAVTPGNPGVDYSQFDNKLIDSREIQGHNPVAVAFGDNNLILVYVRDNKIFYRSSANMGLTLNAEEEITALKALQHPHVFARGNKITVAASANYKVYTVQGTFSSINGTVEFSQAAKEITGIQAHVKGLLGQFVEITEVATFTGAGKGTDGQPLILPISAADLRNPVSVYCVAFAYSVDGNDWTLGNAVRPDQASWNNYDGNKQTSKYLKAKVFKINGNNVEMLAQPRWNEQQARGLGVFDANYQVNYNAKSYTAYKTVASDSQSIFETAIASDGTYLIGSIERDNYGPKKIVLRKYKGQSLGSLERTVTVSENGNESSVVVFGDGTIATFVNENYQYITDPNNVTFTGKLVYKRFTPTYFDTHDVIGN